MSISSDFNNSREEEQQKEFLDEEEENEVGFEELVGAKDGNDRTGDQFKEEEDEAVRDKKVDFLQQLHPNIKEKLVGNIWGITNLDPLRFIIANKDYNRIIRATTHKRKKLVPDNNGNFDENKYEIIPYLKPRDIIFNAIPIEIISHENPLGFVEHKFTIRFTTNTGKKVSIGPRTIEEIVAELRERALVCTSRGASEALSIIINAFITDNKLKINDEIEAPGFYYINGKLRCYRINYTRQPSKKQIQQCAELLDILVTKYRRKEIIPTIIKWGIIAPFNFVLKQYTNDERWLPWLYPYGWTRTGKTTIGKIVNGIWGKYTDTKHRISFTSINSEAKFGFILNQTTCPITINEVGALGDDRQKVMLEMVKNSIESTVARSKHVNKTIYTDIPALCPCVLTSNPQPPKDPGLRSKIIPIVFTKEDRHSPEEKAAFDMLMAQRAAQLKLLGDFAANYIMKNHHVLLKKNKEECNWKETAKVVIAEFYKAGGLDAPNWIDYFLEEELHIVEDSADDVRLLVRAFFINLINDTYNKYARIYDETQGMEKTFHMRFNFCCEKQLIPSITLINRSQTVVIFSDIIKELRNPKSGIDSSEVASLQELANTIGLEYGQKWLNGKNTKVAYGEMSKFISFLDSEVEDNENPQQSETAPAQAA
jgi:hypothetical protein